MNIKTIVHFKTFCVYAKEKRLPKNKMIIKISLGGNSDTYQKFFSFRLK